VASAPAPCVVPKLRGKELKAARKRIKAADCKLGKVTRKGTVGRGAKVVKQTPKAGTVRAAGSKVDVVLGAA
jgi:beta-lactam-binding protein with PASTA domain